MQKDITVSQYKNTLTNARFGKHQLESVYALFSLPGHEGTAGQIATLLGFDESKYGVANLALGKAGHKIFDCVACSSRLGHDERDGWFSVAASWNPNKAAWRLHSNLVKALGELPQRYKFIELNDDETSCAESLTEGRKLRVFVSLYERSAAARRRCVEIHGPQCKVCGMDFQSVYGELGKAFIHVHHVVPLSGISEKYVVDPAADLVPVCPNCHAMLHRKIPPYTVDELGKMIQPGK